MVQITSKNSESKIFDSFSKNITGNDFDLHVRKWGWNEPQECTLRQLCRRKQLKSKTFNQNKPKIEMNHCYSVLTTKQDLASSLKFGSPNHKYHKNFDFKLNFWSTFSVYRSQKRTFIVCTSASRGFSASEWCPVLELGLGQNTGRLFPPNSTRTCHLSTSPGVLWLPGRPQVSHFRIMHSWKWG